MAPSKKREAAEIEKFTCLSCAGDKPSRMFPDYNPSPDCDHTINTCKSCLKKWVEASIEEANFKTGTLAAGDENGGEGEEIGKKEVWGVGCPECKAVMRAVNVQIAVTKKVYQRYDDHERRHIGETTPNWRWCLAPGCRAGQVHIPKVTRPPSPPQEPPTKRHKRGPAKGSVENPISISDSSDDIITCNTCSFQTCAPCDRPLHAGESCTAYQARIKDRLAEEDAALKEVAKASRPCPGCGKRIQKNGGCPSMHCTACGKGFCWNCLSVFDRGYCRCYPRPREL